MTTTTSPRTAVRKPDMARFVSYLQDRHAEAANATQEQMLAVLIEHCVAEVRDLDIERTMATLVDEPVYHWWGDLSVMRSLGATPRETLHRAQIKADYEQAMAVGTLRMDAIELEVQRFFINDDAICWDGPAYMLIPGGLLAQTGQELPDDGGPEDIFVQVSRCAIFISFSEGRMVGEDYYMDGNVTYHKLTD